MKHINKLTCIICRKKASYAASYLYEGKEACLCLNHALEYDKYMAGWDSYPINFDHSHDVISAMKKKENK